jgi:hypothetical protein
LRELPSSRRSNPRSSRLDSKWQGRENAQPRAGESRVGLTILWVLAVLLFGVGDLLTTSIAFSLGAFEGSPLAGYLLRISGGNIWSLTILKSFILSSLLLISYLRMEGYAWTVPAMLSCAGAYMLFHNLAVVALLL